MANTHIGEISINTEMGEFVFRPTFCRIAEIGEPLEISEAFFNVQTGCLKTSIAALNSLCDTDPAPIIGEYLPADSGRVIYSAGSMSEAEIIALALRLLRDGLIGRPSKFELDTIKSSPESKGFDPAEFVSIGDAHLTGRDWWGATMIELQRAIKSKFGQSEAEKSYISADELRDLYKSVGRK